MRYFSFLLEGRNPHLVGYLSWSVKNSGIISLGRCRHSGIVGVFNFTKKIIFSWQPNWGQKVSYGVWAVLLRNLKNTLWKRLTRLPEVFICRQEYPKNVENTMLSLGKKRWVEHFHDNHHRFSREVALILIVQRRSRVCSLLWRNYHKWT